MQQIKALILALFIPAISFAGTRTNETVQVRVGTEARAANGKVKVRFIEMLDDSRCPKGTTCVWSGEAKIKLLVSTAGRKRFVELSTLKQNDTAEAGCYRIRLMDVTPHPEINVRVDPKKYTAVLEIGRIGK